MISVIVSTYNWPEALFACLQSLCNQNDHDFEILVADDGSTSATRDMIRNHYANDAIPVKHVYQEDQGFRLSTIRNKAISQSKGSYLIFLDGDCIVFPDFINKHRHLASTGYFVSGNRMLLSKTFTETVLKERIPLYSHSFYDFISYWLTGKVNRITPLLRLPLGRLRTIKPEQWQKAKGCNLAIWKQDLLAVNGFDELFEGWGYEDSDIVIRLMHNQVRRKEGRFAVSVVHLWHPQNDQSQHDQNYQRLMERLKQTHFIRAEKGVDQYI